MYICVYLELNRYRYFPIFCPNFLFSFLFFNLNAENTILKKYLLEGEGKCLRRQGICCVSKRFSLIHSTKAGKHKTGYPCGSRAREVDSLLVSQSS